MIRRIERVCNFWLNPIFHRIYEIECRIRLREIELIFTQVFFCHKGHTYSYYTGHMVRLDLIFIVGLTVKLYSDIWYKVTRRPKSKLGKYSALQRYSPPLAFYLFCYITAFSSMFFIWIECDGSEHKNLSWWSEMRKIYTYNFFF